MFHVYYAKSSTKSPFSVLYFMNCWAIFHGPPKWWCTFCITLTKFDNLFYSPEYLWQRYASVVCIKTMECDWNLIEYTSLYFLFQLLNLVCNSILICVSIRLIFVRKSFSLFFFTPKSSIELNHLHFNNIIIVIDQWLYGKKGQQKTEGSPMMDDDGRRNRETGWKKWIEQCNACLNDSLLVIEKRICCV